MTISQYNRIKDELNGMIRDISPERMEEIYFERAYESGKLLWIETDREAFEASEAELEQFIEKMTISQRRAAMVGQLKAYYYLLYDLRCVLRSEGIQSLALTIANNHLLEMVLDDLDTYEGTGDKYWYDTAKDLLKQLTGMFNDRYSNEDTIRQFEKFVQQHSEVEDLTPDDSNYLDLISEFTNRYWTIQRLKSEEKAE